MKRSSRRQFRIPCLWIVAVALTVVLVRSDAGLAQTVVTEPPPTASETELQRAERELAARVVELQRAQEAESKQHDVVDDLQELVNRLGEEGDPAALAKSRADLETAQETLNRLTQGTRTAAALHEQARQKHSIAKRDAELRTQKPGASGTGDGATGPLDAILAIRTRAEIASQELELARERTRTLEQQLQTMLLRQREMRRTSDALSQRLNDSASLAAEERSKLWAERQTYVESTRKLADEIQQTREEILLAQATLQIREEVAHREAHSYAEWKQSMMSSGIVVGLVLLLFLITRLMVARRIRDAHRRYTVNKMLSLATTMTLILGLVFVFADQFSNLLTMFGLALAGVTIALQEVVASFAAWFVIRSSRGYWNGEWIQIGDQFGEVVDVGFLRTTVHQHHSLASDGRPGGAWPTGGLTLFMNSTIFKQPLVNFSRGYPFVWCSLTWNVTFESDWEQAIVLANEAMNSEPEITDTIRQATNALDEMASEFTVRKESTQPVVRVWTAGMGVELTARFLAHPRRRPLLMDRVNLKFLKAVQKTDNIRFAYWTTRSIPTPKLPEVLVPPLLEEDDPVLSEATTEKQSPVATERSGHAGDVSPEPAKF